MAVVGYIDQWNINGDEYDIHDKGRGVPNGVATLDGDGRIPYSQLPESAIELKGYWDADTNSPTLVDGTGTNGDEYIVSIAGTQDLGSGSQYFGVGDRVLYTSGVWKNISSGFVRSVDNQSPNSEGNITLPKSDVAVSDGSNTIFSAKGASDYTLNSSTAKSWLGKVFGQFLCKDWKSTLMSSSQGTRNEMLHLFSLNDKAIAVARKGFYVSEDGITWSKVLEFDYGSDNVDVYDGIYANGVYLINIHTSSGNTYLYRSVDGTHWTALSNIGVQCPIVYFSGKFISMYSLVSYSNCRSIVWSEDGEVWTEVSILPSSTYFYVESYIDQRENGDRGSLVEYNNELYVITQSGVVYTSVDGIIWTQKNWSFDSAVHNILVDSTIILARSSTKIYWSEDNGTTWTGVSIGSSSSGSTSITKVVDKYFIEGYDGLYTSLDGKTWTKILSGNATYYNCQIMYYNGVYVLSKGKYLLVSLDGITWTTKYSGSSSSRSYVKAKNGLYVRVFATSVYLSTDGVTWSEYILDNHSTYLMSLYFKNGWIILGSYYDTSQGFNGIKFSGIDTLIENGFFA